MATASTNPENVIITALGKLHPDYTITVIRPVSEQYPYIHVTDGKKYCNIQIRLASHHWDVTTLDRLVTKAIKQIEPDPPKPLKKGSE